MGICSCCVPAEKTCGNTLSPEPPRPGVRLFTVGNGSWWDWLCGWSLRVKHGTSQVSHPLWQSGKKRLNRILERLNSPVSLPRGLMNFSEGSLPGVQTQRPAASSRIMKLSDCMCAIGFLSTIHNHQSPLFVLCWHGYTGLSKFNKTFLHILLAPLTL